MVALELGLRGSADAVEFIRLLGHRLRGAEISAELRGNALEVRIRKLRNPASVYELVQTLQAIERMAAEHERALAMRRQP